MLGSSQGDKEGGAADGAQLRLVGASRQATQATGLVLFIPFASEDATTYPQCFRSTVLY